MPSYRKWPRPKRSISPCRKASAVRAVRLPGAMRSARRRCATCWPISRRIMAKTATGSRLSSHVARQRKGRFLGEHHPSLSAADAQALAERVAAAMWSRDDASKGLGMRIVSVAPGRAELTMTVRADMLNGHAICHGGFIFTLADSAFAFACNSYNLNTVASGCGIDFLAPAHDGDVLTARAHERALAGRTGVYDVEVANQRGETVALFRGKSYRIRGHLVEDPKGPVLEDPKR